MNRKGFTLAELIGVVIVMGLIILVIVTPILSQIKKKSSSIDEVTKQLLISTAETYIDQNPNKYILDSNKTYYISVGLLIERGLLKKDYLNKYNNDVLSENTIIEVTNEGNSFEYEILNNSTYSTIGEIEKSFDTSTFSFMNGTYYKDTPTNSYVLFNNILHKVLGKNEDGTIRIMAVENVTKLIIGKLSHTYANSYVRNWLNDEYYSNLLDNDYIKKQKWCVDIQETPQAATTCNSTINDYVGLITMMELKQHNSLNINFYNYKYLTMTQNTTNYFYTIDSSSENYITEHRAQYALNVRPVINILPSTPILSGTGSIDNPYTLLNNSDDEYTNTRLKDSYLSIGQYVKYNNYYFRIMEIGAGYIKLIMEPETPLTAGIFSTIPNRFNLNNGVGYLLNTTFRSYFIPTDENLNLTLNDKIYIGEYADLASNYKTTYLLKTNKINGAIAGAPKLGEFFAVAPKRCFLIPDTCPSYWLMTENNDDKAFYTSYHDVAPIEKSVNTRSVLPVIYITNEGIILNGSGTQNNPFVLGGK